MDIPKIKIKYIFAQFRATGFGIVFELESLKLYLIYYYIIIFNLIYFMIFGREKIPTYSRLWFLKLGRFGFT